MTRTHSNPDLQSLAGSLTKCVKRQTVQMSERVCSCRTASFFTRRRTSQRDYKLQNITWLLSNPGLSSVKTKRQKTSSLKNQRPNSDYKGPRPNNLPQFFLDPAQILQGLRSAAWQTRDLKELRILLQPAPVIS